MKKRYIETVKRRIYDYVVSNYRRIENFTMGSGVWNYRCHMNSVQAVKEGKAAKVIACIAIYKSNWEEIVAHFINQLEDGTYQDNTWGWEYDQYRYYLVREVHHAEYGEIENILEGLQKTLANDHSSRFLRKLFGIKRGNFI